MRAIIDPIKMLKLQAFVCTEETRYYLHGVYVEPDPDGGVRMVATDGHCMGLFVDRDGRCDGSGIVRLEKPFVDAMTEAVDALDRDPVLVVDGKPDGLSIALLVERGCLLSTEDVIGTTLATWLRVCLSAQGDVLLDGDFPDYKRLMPSQPIEPSDFKPVLEARLLTRFTQIGGEGRTGVRIHPACEEGPVFVEVCGAYEFLGAIMPMRWLPERPDGALINHVLGARASEGAGDE